MEHEQLRNKLESLDLGKVNGLQWDEERAWSRLNSQLQTTRQKKVLGWSYRIAASIVLLVAFLFGYYLMEQEGSALSTGVKEEQVTSEVTNKSEQTPQEQVQIAENYSLEENETNMVEHMDETVVVVAPLDQKTKPTTIKADEIGVVEQAKNTTPILLENKELKGQETPAGEILEGTEAIAMHETEPPKLKIDLSSVPVEKKDKKLSIKLFKKKRAPNSNNDLKLPALTLFASK